MAVLTTVGVVVTAPPAAAYPSNTVSLTGHGYGHGRGMGQWGAFGYALAGTPWKTIVSHYYSGSTPTLTTPAQEGTFVRVALTENNGNDVIVMSANGFTVRAGHDHHPRGGQAPCSCTRTVPVAGTLRRARLRRWLGGTDRQRRGRPGGRARQQLEHRGPQRRQPRPAALPGRRQPVRPRLPARPPTTRSAQARTVNVLPLEDYIVGVVPNESPAYWGQIGSAGPDGYPWGFQSLEAQAVAARSYVMAALGSYGGYADTCDLSCQTYRGLDEREPRSPTTPPSTPSGTSWRRARRS